MASPTSSKMAPVNFTGLKPIQLESFAYLTPGWYRFRIDDAQYNTATTNNDGKTVNASVTWRLEVVKVLSDIDEPEDAIGNKIRDTFWYGSKGDFGMGRLLGALEALHGKVPKTKDGKDINGPLDLSRYEGEEVLCRVDDNNYNGRTTTQVQQYAHVDREEKIIASLKKRHAGAPTARPSSIPADMPVEPINDEFE